AAAAGKLGGPVLLTPANALPGSVKSELSRLKPQRVVVLGGTGSVSTKVESQAKSYAGSVSRQGGENRYDTAVAVSKVTYPSAGVPVVYLANGLNFPDALSGAAAAGKLGGPVLLTPANALPGSVKSELSRLKPQRVVVLGGAGSVSTKVESQAKSYAGSVSRQGGANRYDTAVAVSKATYSSAGVPVVYLANGLNFPDALSGAAAAGKLGGPVLLTPANALPGSVKSELSRLKPQRVVVLGGTGSVSAKVAADVSAYVR
ncbi:cell wall-binding repeat-containing protein, partial [Microbacterium sp. NPDC058342]|uniref:cell wall-binding repeat-containing protein n=1 Tax=Microbacterium sp. NPDC058342 TaxID=3346454 RepID=UPI003664B18D